MKKIILVLPRMTNVEIIAVSALDFVCENFGISSDVIDELKIIVTEAIINAFDHTNDEMDKIRIEYFLEEETITLYIRDYGPGFNINDVQEPDIYEKIHSKNKRGWGLKLMKSLSDDFKIESDKNGTKITIIKKIK